MRTPMVILLITVAVATYGHASCPSGWINFNSICYRFYGDRLTFSAAERTCQEANSEAHLTSIHSLAENDFIYAMFRLNVGNSPRWIYDYYNRRPMIGVWIGLHQETSDGPWVWTDGTPAGFINWEDGEPNDSYYAELPEDCATLWRTNVLSDTRRHWNDISCDRETMNFICKMPEAEVRLVDGATDSEGRVEVYHSGAWGTVCDDFWGGPDAQVVCRSLDLGRSGTAFSRAEFGDGSGEIVLDNVECSGSESSIFDCPNRGLGVNDCTHAEDAGVRCT